MSESSDEEIISPMRKNRIRPFSSDSEEEIVTNNLKKNRKRKRVIEQYSSSENEDPNNNGEKIDAPYIQKVRKIKRSSGKRYCTQTGNIVPEKIFENEDCGCRNACTKNYNEEERKNIFEKFWGLADFNKQNEPYKIFYKTSMNENENFKVLNLLPRRGRPRRFENIVLAPLYKNIRQVTIAKFKDIIDLLRYIPPEHHDFFKSLSHAQNVDE